MTSAHKQKALQEKYQCILSEMLKQDDNKYCADCDAKGPRWASWSLGVFLCIRCAGIHRKLGVHLSRVKSVNLDSWTPEQIASMREMGNDRARAAYEANLPSDFRRPQADHPLEQLIRAKYESKRYIAQEWVKTKPVVTPDLLEVPSTRRLSSSGMRTSRSTPSQLDKPPTASVKPMPRPKASPSSAKKDEIKKQSDVVKKTVPSANVDLVNLNFESDAPKADAKDDFESLFSDFVSPNPPSAVPMAQPSNVAKPTSNADLLGDVFSGSARKEDAALHDGGNAMADSILALYGNKPGGNQQQPDNHMAFGSQGGYQFGQLPQQKQQYVAPTASTSFGRGYSQASTGSAPFSSSSSATQQAEYLRQVQLQMANMTTGMGSPSPHFSPQAPSGQGAPPGCTLSDLLWD